MEYRRIHTWLSHHHRQEKNVCEFCAETKNLTFALIHGKKYEKNRANYLVLCVRCHKEYDKIKCNNCENGTQNKSLLCFDCKIQEEYKKNIIVIKCLFPPCVNVIARHKDNSRTKFCSNRCRIKNFMRDPAHRKEQAKRNVIYLTNRYKTDTKFRKRMNKYQRDLYHKNMKNPIFREKSRERSKKWSAIRRKRMILHRKYPHKF